MQTVLIVDDIADNLYYLEVLLKGNGFEVRSAGNGAEALESARKNPPNLIVSDILMPVMDGYALCREWRADELLRQIPFIFYTATFIEKQDEALALGLGADRFIIKPQEPEALMGIIKEVLANSFLGDATAAFAMHPEEEGLLREYSEALFRKLEKKMVELERVNRELRDEIAEHKRAEEEKSKLESQLLQSQKMEAVGQLAGGVAHDFNNMLGVIIGHSELALMKLKPTEPIYNNITEICTAAERSADLTRQLLAFARKQKISPKVIDLNKTISGILNMLQRLIGENSRLIFQSGSNLWPLKVDPSQIDQILANLCVNARDAIKGLGRITIETDNKTVDASYHGSSHEYVDPGEYVRLTVSDDGCGMDRETQAHIFEPFFTTKGVGEGTGLGLATIYGIVKQNNGFINVYSEPGQGTTFSIYLPRCTGESAQVLKETMGKPLDRGTETILLVEDEPSILTMAALQLEGQGYKVLTAGTAGEAIRLFGEHAGTIQMLITDVIMPDINCRDLVKELLLLNPELKCLFMSGYTANVIDHYGVLDEGVHFIQKPFSLSVLATKVREMLDSPVS